MFGRQQGARLFRRTHGGAEGGITGVRFWCRRAIDDGLSDREFAFRRAKEVIGFLGSPEGELAIAQAVIYCATAPKSNAGYAAFGAAMRVAKEAGSLVPPKHILNAPTRLMQEEGYGRGYAYDHDVAE